MSRENPDHSFDPNFAPNRAEALEYAKLLEEQEKRKKYRALEFFKPYPKQLDFLNLTAKKREVALIAANQSGKSYAAAGGVAQWLTGMYQPWFQGRRFDGPVNGWVAGETGQFVRDVGQRLLFGKPGVVDLRGTGMVPRGSVDWERGTATAHGYAGLFDTVQVKHKDGGTSTVRFMTYEMARERWQGETLDFIWCDEEPPLDLYIEGITRLIARSGIMICTFTPLKGRTDVVQRFMSDDDEGAAARAYVNMTLDEIGHITTDEKVKIIASYPPYMRGAKARGEPMMGVGRIFETDEEHLKEPAINPIPLHWRKLWTIDFGTDHPFAAVLNLYDPDADCIHVAHTVRMRGSKPIEHAAAMKPFGTEIPVAWPHDGHIRERGSVQPVMRLYKDAGLNILQSHAAFPDGSISTEAGIQFMDDRMKTGRYRVASHLVDWFEEYRQYHRKPKKDGSSEIVKKNDDIMSCSRLGVMAIRFARVSNADFFAKPKQRTSMVKDCDYNVLDWAA